MLAVLKARLKPKRRTAVEKEKPSANLNNNVNRKAGLLLRKPTGEKGEGGLVRTSRGRDVRSLIVLDSGSPAMQLATGGGSTLPIGSRQVHPEMCQTPNICVQGGRIEFIKPNQAAPDPLRETLERRVAELEKELEEERRSTLQERRNTARFQALLTDRECLAKDVERERWRGEEAERRLEEARTEAESTKRRLSRLQQHSVRLEESLKSMSLYKTKYQRLKAENASLTATYQRRREEEERRLAELTAENEALRTQLSQLESIRVSEREARERLEEREAEKRRLVAERQECERCLDQVAHQVVQALLSQKALTEEVSTQRDRIKELQRHNRTLVSLLLRSSSLLVKDGSGVRTGGERRRPVSCDGDRARWRESLLSLSAGAAASDRPASLDLDLDLGTVRLIASLIDNHGEVQKDEGYSTMSSEAQGEGGEEEPVTGKKTGGASGGWPCSPVTRAASEPGLRSPSLGGEESDYWEQLWEAEPESGPDAPVDLEEWLMDDISWLGGEGSEEEGWLRHAGSPHPGSWSSSGGAGSKRSSALSDPGPDPDPDSCQVGTSFTSDFYRLVKFESSKSLAGSTSSRSQADCSVERDNPTAAAQIHHSHRPSSVEPSDSAPEESGLDRDDTSADSPVSSNPEENREGRGLVTVPEEEESVTSSTSTPETVLQDTSESRREKGSGLETSTASLRQISSLESSTVSVSSPQPRASVLSQLDQFAGSDDDFSPPQALVGLEDSGCPTGWVHLDSPSDLTDPKMRANLLMLSRSSSSCSSESGDDHSGYQRLHRLHRSRRHNKASASREGPVRCHSGGRSSILGREDLFVRFGSKEQEAVASFDFLEELIVEESSRESTLNPR